MTNNHLSKTTARIIINMLIQQWEGVANKNIDTGIDIIQEVWKEISSSLLQKSVEELVEDLAQHYVRNNDYETGYMFEEVLKVYHLDFKSLKLFIELILKPSNFNDIASLNSFSTLIDYELSKDDFRLVVINYDELNFPLQIVDENKNLDGLPQNVKLNDIPFYVYKETRIHPSEEKYFALIPNKRWNDYGVISVFSMKYYYDFGRKSIDMGGLRIIHKDEFTTWELLPEKFLQLDNQFCSIGFSDNYYEDFLRIFEFGNTVSILFALKDAAYFSDIQEKFEKTYNFTKSLIRADNSERSLRQVRPLLDGANMENFYSFKYTFKPAYSTEATTVNFDFNTRSMIANRIFGVIGRNGAGKTQLLNNLPHSLSEKKAEEFYNAIPSFSKVIAISYSVFDNFILPQKNVNLNYVYCGLKDSEGDLRSNKGLVVSFHHNWKKIQDQGRIVKWRKILLNFIDIEIIDEFISDEDIEFTETNPAVNVNDFNRIKNRLSSGQSILLYIITQVVANIRFDSLLLYDEPETHLHPNAVVELMNTLYDLVNEFESFCIIATHSPIVIRELFSKNVYILERESNFPVIRRIGIESFGENLGILTDEVFGDRGVPKQYKKILLQLVKDGKTFDEIINILEFDEMPLSLNTRIFLKHIVEKNNE